MLTRGRDDLRIVVRYRRGATNGLHVLLGALDAERPPGRWDVAFAATVEDTREAIAAGLAEAERVLVLWSFYSADAPAVAAERAQLGGDERVLHLAGGVHASAQPHAVLGDGFDVVAVGEGEATLVALVAALGAGDDLATVPGLVLPAGSTGPAPRHGLDRYPAFAARWGRYNPIEITRGCIYACRFCQTPYLFKARFRHRSVENVRQHVRHMRSVGLRYARFVTPTALSYGADGEEPELAAVEALLSGVRQELGADGKLYFGGFPSELRPEHVTPAAMAVLKRYVDNSAVVIGAQSGSEAVLSSSKRGHGVEVVERAVRVAGEAGFRADVDFLFGLPGETEGDARASLALADRLAGLGARIHAHTFLPLPGTPYSGAPPGTTSEATRAALERLTGRGAAYGQWRAQEDTARRLVPLVRRPRPGPAVADLGAPGHEDPPAGTAR